MAQDDSQSGTGPTGHVWLDAISTWDPESPEYWESAVATAYPRFEEVGAVSATFDDETDVLTLDISNLLGSGLQIMEYLLVALAEVSGQHRDDWILRLREQMDDQG